MKPGPGGRTRHRANWQRRLRARTLVTVRVRELRLHGSLVASEVS